MTQDMNQSTFHNTSLVPSCSVLARAASTQIAQPCWALCSSSPSPVPNAPLHLLVSYINFHNKPHKELDFRVLRNGDLQARSALTAQE